MTVKWYKKFELICYRIESEIKYDEGASYVKLICYRIERLRSCVSMKEIEKLLICYRIERLNSLFENRENTFVNLL